jgi:hypothetical protein
MAKIEKLKKDVEDASTTIYPVTIPQAVIDPTSGKSARSELDEKANHGYESNPKTLKSVDDAKADHGYESNPKTLKQVDDEVIQLAGDVKDTTEKAGASSLAELNARLLALEKIISSSLRSTIEVTKEFNVWGKTNLILTGSGAATFAPDFVGQKYIDTTNSNVYVAVGVSTAGNWKLV